MSYPGLPVSRKNPFDYIHEIVDESIPFEENVKKVLSLMNKGEMDMYQVATLVVEASAMPAIAADNLDLRQMVDELKMKLDNLSKSQDDSGHCGSNILRFPNGQVVN